MGGPDTAQMEPELCDPDQRASDRILALITAAGPISAADLAARLGVTPTAVRRQLGLLETDGLVQVHEPPRQPGVRGRPARHYVTSALGQRELSGGYADIALQAMRQLERVGGEAAVAAFADERWAGQRERYARLITAADPAERAQQLADALTADGYAATVRPVPGTIAIQLCQGHCPVQRVAERFPQLCEAEAAAFSDLLDSHVQRLATIASGGHACTTNIPVPPTETPRRRQGRFRTTPR